MKLRGLTLTLNDRCNYRCVYCYKEKGRKAALSYRRARGALTFLWPFLARTYHLSFYGGEPLLSFETIRRLTSFLRDQESVSGKKARLAITTNGSLLSDEVIDFLGRERFTVTVSFDGLAQDRQRLPGSFEQILGRLRALRRRPGLDLRVNSVFTPETVDCLSPSVRLLLRSGIGRISYALSVSKPWDKPSLARLEDELAKVRRLVLRRYRRRGDIPVDDFRDSGTGGVFGCAGGKDWLAISAEGKVWGCAFFDDYFFGKRRSREYRDYSFGSLAWFRRNPGLVHARHAPSYSRLTQDKFRSSRGPCFLCPELGRCAVCPAVAALSGGSLEFVPDSLCEIQRIRSRQIRIFRERSA